MASMVDQTNVHPGVVKMKSLAQMYVYWPNISDNIERVIVMCNECQQKSTPVKSNHNLWAYPQRAGSTVHINYTSLERHHYLVNVDAYS